MKQYILLFTPSIALFWFNWLLVGFAWNNFYGVFHTIANYAHIIIVITIIITGILLIIQIIKKLKGSDGIYFLKNFLGIILGILIVLSLIYVHFQVFVKINTNRYDTASFGHICSKNEIAGDYYFYMKNLGWNIRFKTDKLSYEKLIVNEKVLFTYEYRTDFFDNSQGIIQSFDFD